MEQWDLYDLGRNRTGETMKRGDVIPEGRYHLVVHACVFNAVGEMLIQQRQPFKEGFPNHWDISAGGSSVAGETSQMAIQREMQEEIGLLIDFHDVRPHLTVNFSRGFDDYYLVQREVDLSTLRLQPEEVQAVKWASEQDILAMLKKGEFVPYHAQWVSLLFAMRGKYGSLNI